MKHFFGLILLITLANFSFAQAGFRPVGSTSNIQQALSKNAAATQTISSDFSQSKVMKMMNVEVKSKGKFYFKQKDRVRIEYTQPNSYIMVLNGGSIAVKEQNRVTKVNTRNSATMQSVNRVMMDCLRGTVFNNADFTVKAFEARSQYLLKLYPKTSSMKGLFKTIDVYINKLDNQVDRLVMTENGGDYTTMNFFNQISNASLSDALFTLR